jgi:hypothetical protein
MRFARRYWLGDLSARVHVTLGTKNNVLQRTKSHHMRLTYPLLPFIGVEFSHTFSPFAPMRQALPENVELLSLNSQYEQVPRACAFEAVMPCGFYLYVCNAPAPRATLCCACATSTRRESTPRCRSPCRSTLPPCSSASKSSAFRRPLFPVLPTFPPSIPCRHRPPP